MADPLNDFYFEASAELARGNAALWLGPELKPTVPEDKPSLAEIPWLAIWSESTSGEFVRAVIRAWSNDPDLKRRAVVEVRGRLAESLGSYYSLAEICPFFYLHGRENEWSSIPERERRRARDEQVDQLEKLGKSTLVVTGHSDGVRLAETLLDAFPASPAIGRLLVCDLPAAAEEAFVELVAQRSPSLLRRLRLSPTSITDLVEHVRSRLLEEPVQPTSVRVRSRLVPIQRLLERETPLDQDFLILTADVLRAPSRLEKPSDLVEELVSGARPPWRAFAHGLHWNRNEGVVDKSLRFLRDFESKGRQTVACLNLPAQPGSGLTTLLFEIAFRCAELGYPTLVWRPESRQIDYDALRVFLEALDSPEGSSSTAVLVFDDSGLGLESTGIRDLPLRLSRDGRHALIIRGVSVRTIADFDLSFKRKRQLVAASHKVIEDWIDPPLGNTLTATERVSLCEWAGQHWSGATEERFRRAVETWGADWFATGDPPPLLVGLYFLLRDNLERSSDLGSHLVARVRGTPGTCADTPEVIAPDDARHVVTGRDLEDAMRRLRGHFCRIEAATGAAGGPLGEALEARPTKQDVGGIFVALATLGCLRVAAPRPVLESVTQVPHDRLLAATIALEREDLVVTGLEREAANLSGLHARAAFYTASETVGLRHPAYGRLAIDWLRKNPAEPGGAFEHGGWLGEIRGLIEEEALRDYPIRLLVPLLRRLRPTRSDVDFAAYLCSRLLRFQRIRGSPYHEWLLQNRQADTLLEVLSEIPEEVVRESTVILHTRGITRYKSCDHGRPLDECRRRYEAASLDLELAFDRTKSELQGDQPVTILTSHGLLFKNWADQERTRYAEGGDATLARQLRERARNYLREGLRLRRENTYAAYGLAESLVEDCERDDFGLGSENTDSFVRALAEAFDLLEAEPESAFADEWESLRVRALTLLEGEQSDRAIAALKAQGKGLGFALEALRTLKGRIPIEPTEDPQEERRLRAALELLSGTDIAKADGSALVDLIRYATFSALPERLRVPAYEERFRLIRPLRNTLYMERPVWLYDYGMLALQTVQHREASDAFRQLRKGRRFLEVPLERACWLTRPQAETEVQIVTLRILSVSGDGKGWARVDEPRGIIDPVPFVESRFVAAGSPARPGATVAARLKIRSAGPAAEPVGLDRGLAR
jgi:hypothetical protein